MKTNLDFALRKEISAILTWIQHWETDINDINSIIEWYNKYVSHGQNFDFQSSMQFLITHSIFAERIQQQILKPTVDPKILEEMESKRIDLPNEWQDIMIKLQSHKKNSILTMYKSSVIRQLSDNLMNTFNNSKTESVKTPCIQSIEVLDKTIRKLEYQCKNLMENMLVCYFCGRICSKKICNKECMGNKPGKSMEWFKPFHDDKPAVTWLGSRCHYWGKPNFYGNPLKYLEITDGRGSLMITESFEQNIVLFVIYWLMKFIKALVENQLPVNKFIYNFKLSKKSTIVRGISRIVDVKGNLSGEIYIKSLQ